MPGNKTVSVILPNYNYANYLKSRINEVLSQTYPISEIIILDDASTDNSQKVIEEEINRIKGQHPEITVKCVMNEKNSGNVFLQWQKGIKLATSNYVWICELDDISKQNFLEVTMKSFDDKNVVLSYCNSKIIDANGKMPLKDNLRRIKDVFRKKHNIGSYIVDGVEEINNNLAVYNSMPNVSAIVFKNQPKLSSFLDTAKNYKLCGDWYFYLMVATTGKIAFSNKVLNSHRVHQKSVTKNTSLNERYKEMQEIHKFAKNNTKLSEPTISRMDKIELDLAKKWKIKEN